MEQCIQQCNCFYRILLAEASNGDRALSHYFIAEFYPCIFVDDKIFPDKRSFAELRYDPKILGIFVLPHRIGYEVENGKYLYETREEAEIGKYDYA